MADPYGISEAPPGPGLRRERGAGVGANPYRGPSVYRGPEAAIAPPNTNAGTCPPGADCSSMGPAPVMMGPHPFTAVRASPFVQMLGGAFHFRERLSSAAAFGGEFGFFAWDRLRAGVRAIVPVADLNDEASDNTGSDDPSAWMWGISVGAAATRQAGFVMSPSLQYLAMLGGDYGQMIGILVPFEWLSRKGFHVGFDFSVLYGFGGTYRTNTCPTCSELVDRPNSAGFAVNLVLGHVFAMPDEPSSG